MTLSEQIALRAAELPVDRQREVLDFVEFLRGRERPAPSSRRASGLFAGAAYSMSDDFDEALPEAFWLGSTP